MLTNFSGRPLNRPVICTPTSSYPTEPLFFEQTTDMAIFSVDTEPPLGLHPECMSKKSSQLFKLIRNGTETFAITRIKCNTAYSMPSAYCMQCKCSCKHKFCSTFTTLSIFRRKIFLVIASVPAEVVCTYAIVQMPNPHSTVLCTADLARLFDGLI